VVDSTEITNIETVGIDGPPGSDGVLPPGTKFGRYVIQKVLGEGGMGVVYEAFDPSLNRKIAIKVLRVSKTIGTAMDTRSAKDRLLREAQAMAQVGHPNLVAVYDVGTYGDSVFIAMEFVNGKTLRDWRPDVPKKDWRSVLDAYIQAGAGLSAAHHCKLIHRDFKPENVMIGYEDSRVRVMDFGLVRSVSTPEDLEGNTSDALAKPLTQTGMIMGTPAYMAPEQFLGEPTDHRTDQFAFCVALYEAMYGHRPFKGKTASALARNVLRGHIELPTRKSNTVPGYVLDALLKGLQTDPADRHDSMDVMLDALREPADTPSRPWLLYITTILVAGAGWGLYYMSNDAKEHNDQRSISTALTNTPEPAPKPVPPDLPKPEPKPVGVLPEGAVEEIKVTYAKDIARCVQVAKELDVIDAQVFLAITINIEGGTEMVESTREGSDQIVVMCLQRYAEKWAWPKPVGGQAKAAVTIPLRAPSPPPKRRAR